MKVETKQKTELKKRHKAECRGEGNKRSSLLLTPLTLSTVHWKPRAVCSLLLGQMARACFQISCPTGWGRRGQEGVQEQSAVITEGRAHTRRAALQLPPGPNQPCHAKELQRSYVHVWWTPNYKEKLLEAEAAIKDFSLLNQGPSPSWLHNNAPSLGSVSPYRRNADYIMQIIIMSETGNEKEALLQ